MQKTISRLRALVQLIPPLLERLPAAEFESKPSNGGWSKKQILGHLIDSATNNHHRFVRAQFEEVPQIQYDQDRWNQYNFYQQADKEHLITFWTTYNRQILFILKCMPPGMYLRRCDTGGRTLTIEFIAEDYVQHMEHHLRQIIDYST
jgi:hypothetical protein